MEHRGRTARGLAPSTREAYAWTMRTYVMPYFRGMRIGDRRTVDPVGPRPALEPLARSRAAQGVGTVRFRGVVGASAIATLGHAVASTTAATPTIPRTGAPVSDMAHPLAAAGRAAARNRLPEADLCRRFSGRKSVGDAELRVRRGGSPATPRPLVHRAPCALPTAGDRPVVSLRIANLALPVPARRSRT